MNFKKPIIVINPMSVDEEYQNIWNQFWNMQWYREHMQRVTIPDHKAFLNLFIYAPNFHSNKDQTQLLEIFKNEIYDSGYYNKYIKEIKDNEGLVFQALEELSKQESLNFKIFDNYTVVLARYGPGGQYNVKESKIILKVADEGLDKEIIYTVVHEIVHLGIEETIVEKYKLSHHDKEALVTWICENVLKNILIGYPKSKNVDNEFYRNLNRFGVRNIVKATQATQK